MVASDMGVLRRMAKWNLWYMNADLDCILDALFSFLFFFFFLCVLLWHLSKFFVFDRYGYRARWTSAYVNTLHCKILSSCEQTLNWHLQHDRGLTKGDCRSNMRHLIQIPGGKGNGDSHFTMDLSSSCGAVQLG